MSARVLVRSTGREGNEASRTAPAPFGVPFSESGFQNPLAAQMENSNARAIGKMGVRVTVGQRTRASLSLGGRCVPPVRAQKAADRDSLAALEQIVESSPALASTFEVGIRPSTGEDLSRISSFYLSSQLSYSRRRRILRLFPSSSDLFSDLWRDLR